MWEYFEEPGREDLLDRFAAAMEGMQNIEPPNLAEEGNYIDEVVLDEEICS